LFCSLTGSHLLKLDRQKTAHEYQRGQIIFYEGNPPLAVYCVYSGVVKLYKAGKNDKRVLIRLLGPGEIIGYRALVADEPYAATAEAVETATICTISRDTLESVLADDFEITMRLMAKLATELRVSEEQMVTRTQDPVRQRTARFLIWLLENLQHPSKKSSAISVPLLREEMAQMIGTTPETLSRILREFANQGLINLDRKNIEVAKLRPLRRLAGG
jgi:CRP/FNR family transcriptional regulator